MPKDPPPSTSLELTLAERVSIIRKKPKRTRTTEDYHFLAEWAYKAGLDKK